MADIGGRAATRLRRTFRYPTDVDDPNNSEPEALDEEGENSPIPRPSSLAVKESSPPTKLTTSPLHAEQEDLIKTLANRNASTNKTHTRILLALPLLATLAYIPQLLSGAVRLPTLLAITSLLSTAFLLYSLPPTVTGFIVLDKQQGGVGGKSRAEATLARSPLEVWLPHLNLGLVVILMLLNLVASSDRMGPGWIVLKNLPAIIYTAVLAAKLIMAHVDPESELRALRYEYKGA